MGIKSLEAVGMVTINHNEKSGVKRVRDGQLIREWIRIRFG